MKWAIYFSCVARTGVAPREVLSRFTFQHPYKSWVGSRGPRVSNHGEHRVGGTEVLMEEVRIAAEAQRPTDAVGSRQQHLVLRQRVGFFGLARLRMAPYFKQEFLP